MVISENCCNFKVLKIKSLQTIIAMITEDKVTEIFCIADDFCKVFDAQMGKYTIKSNTKRRYHREFTMSKAEIEDHCHSIGYLYKEGSLGNIFHFFGVFIETSRLEKRANHCSTMHYLFQYANRPE